MSVDLGFEIPEKKSLDLLSLGALVHRLDPGIIPFRKATNFAVHVSGGEFNVAANLSDCFKLDTGIASAMVEYPIGDLIHERVRAMGVKRGEGIAGPMRKAGVFPPLAAHLLTVGEETGRLDQMFTRMADIYENDTRAAIRRFSARGGGVVATRNKPVTLPTESKLSFRLSSPVTITERLR